jgi:hypothetical protein
MQKRIAAVSWFALILASTLGLPGCGGGNSSASGIVSSLSITPTSTSVSLNGTAEFTACVNNSGCGSTTATNTVTTTITFMVNGVAGGSPSTGTIVPSPTDALVGIYTAPATIGTVNQFMVTAVSPVDPSTPSNTQTITSNTAVVTITPGLGLSVTPTGLDIDAGATQQFTAFLNNLPDHNATWTVAAPNGGNPGIIDPNSGVYQAPPSPPLGGAVVITATDSTLGPGNTATATANATVVYADASLSGPYAFSYTGNGSAGFQAVAGSLFADGKGNISNFVEDILGFQSSGSTTVSCNPQPAANCGTYTVGTDGRGTITLNSQGQTAASTLRFGLTSNQHAVLMRFDAGNTGSGTLDQQNLSDLGGAAIAISGPYAFRAFGGDKNFRPEGLGGLFSASPGNNSATACSSQPAGSTGTIPELDSIVDLNDAGIVTIADTTLQGSYCFDSAFPGTGRGILDLSSTAIGQLQFAFYIVDSTHLYVIETDKNAFLAGDVFSALGLPAGGGGFSTASFAMGSYPFTVGGTAAGNPYSAGGILVSSGAGNITGSSVFDNNANGDVQLTPTFVSCTYAVDPATGRIALSMAVAGAACPAAPVSGTPNSATNAFTFAVYQTNLGSALMLELDAGIVATGTAFQQSVVSTTLTGNFVLNAGAQGLLHGTAGPNQQDALGQLVLNGTTVASGNLDFNIFKNPISNDPLLTVCPATQPNCTLTSIAAAASSGRGTAILSLSNPETTYNLVYYLVNGNTALLFGQAANQTQVVQVGLLERQF